MNCPKCGKENQDNAQSCQFCSTSLEKTSESKQPVTVSISRLSIIALVLAVFSIFVFPPLPILYVLLGKAVLFLPLLAVILGFISIVQIEQSGGRITGRIFAVAAVLIPVFAALLPPWIIATFIPRRSTAFRMLCGTQLSGLGKAMLIYSGDYDNEFPRAGGKNSVWSNRIPDWRATNRFQAFGINPTDGSGGVATITSSLYLLVKYTEVQPKNFICIQDKGVKEFTPADYGVTNEELIDLRDFGSEPTKHCSYSYHMPYGPYALTTSSEPGMAVAADRNPWISSPFARAKDISQFNPDGDRDAIRVGNSVPHKDEGQNVLFMDLHVGFEERSFCGVKDDNIYTYKDGQNIRRGAVPNIKSQPIDRLDSMLVNDILP